MADPRQAGWYEHQSWWRRVLHWFGVPTYTDGEGPCIYCGSWH